MARAKGPKQSREKITVINPFTKKPAEVAKKQYERLGEQRYWYTRERDRIRKTTRLKPAEKERAIHRLEKAKDKGTLYKLGRGALPSEALISTERERGYLVKTGYTKGSHKATLIINAEDFDKAVATGKMDKRSGLTMLSVSRRQTAYDVMQELQVYGLGSKLSELHEGKYQYKDVDEDEIYISDLEELENAYNTNSVDMTEDEYESLHNTLLELIK
jgi:hypothetical protein